MAYFPLGEVVRAINTGIFATKQNKQHTMNWLKILHYKANKTWKKGNSNDRAGGETPTKRKC